MTGNSTGVPPEFEAFVFTLLAMPGTGRMPVALPLCHGHPGHAVAPAIAPCREKVFWISIRIAPPANLCRVILANLRHPSGAGSAKRAASSQAFPRSKFLK